MQRLRWLGVALLVWLAGVLPCVVGNGGAIYSAFSVAGILIPFLVWTALRRSQALPRAALVVLLAWLPLALLAVHWGFSDGAFFPMQGEGTVIWPFLLLPVGFVVSMVLTAYRGMALPVFLTCYAVLGIPYYYWLGTLVDRWVMRHGQGHQTPSSPVSA